MPSIKAYIEHSNFRKIDGRNLYVRILISFLHVEFNLDVLQIPDKIKTKDLHSNLNV